jgi:hypothetical protein
MSVIMSLGMSLAMTLMNVGINEPFFIKAWLSGSGIGFLVSLPLSFLIPPTLQKMMAALRI